MSRKKAAKKADDRPPVKFDIAIPIRSNPDPRDKSHYRILQPGEKLPDEYQAHFTKVFARAFVDTFARLKVRVSEIPEDRFAEVFNAWWGYFWETKQDGQPIGPKAEAFLKLLADMLERKAAARNSPTTDCPAAPSSGKSRKKSKEG